MRKRYFPGQLAAIGTVLVALNLISCGVINFDDRVALTITVPKLPASLRPSIASSVTWELGGSLLDKPTLVNEIDLGNRQAAAKFPSNRTGD